MVQVFGCRHDEAIHALRRPASEKRQGTKSREVGHRRCRGRYGDLSAGRDLSAAQFFGCIGLEGMHNFGVMAQVLLIGESRFLSPCDFKELGVAKRSRSTTSSRSALRQPWSIMARTNIFEGRNKPQCCPTETVSSYSSR